MFDRGRVHLHARRPERRFQLVEVCRYQRRRQLTQLEAACGAPRDEARDRLVVRATRAWVADLCGQKEQRLVGSVRTRPQRDSVDRVALGPTSPPTLELTRTSVVEEFGSAGGRECDMASCPE